MSKKLIARFEELVREVDRLQTRLDSQGEELHDEKATARQLYNENGMLRDNVRDLEHKLTFAENRAVDSRYYRDQYDKLSAENSKLKSELFKYRTQFPTPETSDWVKIADELVKDDILETHEGNNTGFPFFHKEKIGRIKDFRTRTGSGLKEAKEAIEAATSRKWDKEKVFPF